MTNAKNATSAEQMRRHAEEAGELLKQLANPHRLMILCSLAEEEKTVTELLKKMDVSQSSLSQHLARLREAELVEARKRGREVYYRLSRLEVKAMLSVLYLMYCNKR